MTNTTLVRISLGIERKSCGTCKWADDGGGNGCGYRSRDIQTMSAAIAACLYIQHGPTRLAYDLWEPVDG